MLLSVLLFTDTIAGLCSYFWTLTTLFVFIDNILIYYNVALLLTLVTTTALFTDTDKHCNLIY